MGMFSWLGFGGAEKATDNLLDKDDGLLTQVGGWIGNMDYTEEEQAEAYQKLTGVVIQYASNEVDHNSVRSKARRDLAIMWIKVQLVLIMLTAIAIPVDKVMKWSGADSLATQYFALATASVMLAGTSAIIIFYFGSYGWQKVQETRNKK